MWKSSIFFFFYWCPGRLNVQTWECRGFVQWIWMLSSAFIPFSAQGDLFVSTWHLVYSLVVQWLHCRLYTGSLTFVTVIKKTFPCCFLHCFKAICKLKSGENATGCLLSSLSGGKQSGGLLCPVRASSAQRYLPRVSGWEPVHFQISMGSMSPPSLLWQLWWCCFMPSGHV